MASFSQPYPWTHRIGIVTLFVTLQRNLEFEYFVLQIIFFLLLLFVFVCLFVSLKKWIPLWNNDSNYAKIYCDDFFLFFLMKCDYFSHFPSIFHSVSTNIPLHLLKSTWKTIFRVKNSGEPLKLRLEFALRNLHVTLCLHENHHLGCWEVMSGARGKSHSNLCCSHLSKLQHSLVRCTSGPGEEMQPYGKWTCLLSKGLE